MPLCHDAELYEPAGRRRTARSASNRFAVVTPAGPPDGAATDCWRRHHVEIGVPLEIEIGTLRSVIERSAMDWIIRYRHEDDRYLGRTRDVTTQLRHVFRETAPELEVAPATADRNVVVHPADPLHIPAQEQATLYVSTPMWVRFVVAATDVVLADLPVQIMSDCWFGPNTREGELCYSNETQARLWLDRLPSRPERLITPVTVTNAGEDTLRVDRLSLPMPLLTVYRGPSSFWTQELVITREQALATAHITFTPRPPDHLGEVPHASGPRRSEDGSAMTRAMALLFG